MDKTNLFPNFNQISTFPNNFRLKNCNFLLFCPRNIQRESNLRKFFYWNFGISSKIFSIYLSKTISLYFLDFEIHLYLNTLSLFGTVGTVIWSSCTVLVIRTTVPVGFWATSSRTFSFIRSTVCFG